MPKIQTSSCPVQYTEPTTQRYEALPPVAPSTMAYCSKLMVLHRARCGLPDPYLGKAARYQSGGGYDGANRGEWVSGQS